MAGGRLLFFRGKNNIPCIIRPAIFFSSNIMPSFKFFKEFICGISHANLTSSKANISRFSSVAPCERRVVNIFKNVKTSVVTITSISREIGKGKSEIFEHFGSGVVWDTEGHIVTNYHVIRDAIFAPSPDYMDPEVHVLTSEGVKETYNAKIVGANDVDDLAVLKITKPKNILKPITVEESTIVEVGQKYLLIEAPYPHNHILASGIISGLNRVIDVRGKPSVRGMIQIDSYTSAYNSGGPLLDYKGHMIGIHRGGLQYGIRMCIASSVVVKTVTQLIKFNNANCPGLNIMIYPDFISHECGYWIGAVVSHGTPYNCGTDFRRINSDKLIEGDIITAVGDKPVRTKGDLFEILRDYHTGDIIMLKVIRDDLEVKLVITFEDY